MQRHHLYNKPVSFHTAAPLWQRGLTLVELVVTISIFAILIGVGVPMVSSMIAGNQLETEASAIRNALSLARSEAITRRTYITLCARKQGEQECLVGATNNDWRNNGWILFRDTMSSGNANISYDGQVIEVHDGMDSTIDLTVTGTPSHIRFTPRGESSPNTTFRFCVAGASSERYAEEVVVSSGRVRTVSGEATGCL